MTDAEILDWLEKNIDRTHADGIEGGFYVESRGPRYMPTQKTLRDAVKLAVETERNQ